MHEGHDPTPLTDTGSEKAYKAYSYRYFISAFYLIAAIINSLGWVCTSPILEKLQTFYSAIEPIDLGAVTIGASTIYLMIFIPSSFMANAVLEKFGVRIGVLFGSAITILSLWIKTLAKDNFWYILLGQGLGGFAAPFILNTPQRISATWYPAEQRALSTVILSLAAPIGVGIGFVTTPMVVTNDGKDPNTFEQGREQVIRIFNIIAIIGTILMVPSFGLFRERPPTPPSKAAESTESGSGNFMSSLRDLIRNRNYLIYLTAVSLMWGTYGTLATILQPLVTPFGYSSQECGLFGGVVLVMGLTGSPIWGSYVGRTKKYKATLLLLGCLSTAVLTSLRFIGPKNDFYFTALGIGLYGFCTTPMLPIIFELCCELTFPVSESTAGGITYMMTQVVAIIGSYILSKLLNDKTPEGAYKGFGILIAFQVLGVVGFFLTKEELRRTKFEKGEANEDVSTEGFTYAKRVEQ